MLVGDGGGGREGGGRGGGGWLNLKTKYANWRYIFPRGRWVRIELELTTLPCIFICMYISCYVSIFYSIVYECYSLLSFLGSSKSRQTQSECAQARRVAGARWSATYAVLLVYGRQLCNIIDRVTDPLSATRAVSRVPALIMPQLLDASTRVAYCMCARFACLMHVSNGVNNGGGCVGV